MSRILPFVVVAASLAVVASVALREGPQPATAEGGPGREPWTDRGRAVLGRAVRVLRAVLSRAGAATAGAVSAIGERRKRRADTAAERRAIAADRPSRTGEVTAAETVATTTGVPEPSVSPDGVLTTALLVRPDPAIGDVAGERLSQAGPSPLARLRSALGLAALILTLGLGLAAVLGAAVALVSGALDGFVN